MVRSTGVVSGGLRSETATRLPRTREGPRQAQERAYSLSSIML